MKKETLKEKLPPSPSPSPWPQTFPSPTIVPQWPTNPYYGPWTQPHIYC